MARDYPADQIHEIFVRSCLGWCRNALELGEVPESERKEVLDDLEHRLRGMSLSMIVAALNSMLLDGSYPPARQT